MAEEDKKEETPVAEEAQQAENEAEAGEEPEYITAPTDENGAPTVIPASLLGVDRYVDTAKYKAQLIVRTERVESGLVSTEAIGFALGFLLALTFIVLPIAIWMV